MLGRNLLLKGTIKANLMNKISKKLFKNTINLNESNFKIEKFPTHVKLDILPSQEIGGIRNKAFIFGI
jgi:hypothetical protein